MCGQKKWQWTCSTHPSSESKINNCKKDKRQCEKGFQKCLSNHHEHCFIKHCREHLNLFQLKLQNQNLLVVMFEENMLQSSDILQFSEKIQFEIVPLFNVSNTREQLIYLYTVETKGKLKSYFLPPVSRYYFYKIVKIDSCTGHFLLFLRSFVSSIQSMEFVRLKIM